MCPSIEIIERYTGKQPSGNRAFLCQISGKNAAITSNKGVVYDSSPMGDQVPYVLETSTGRAVELPVSWATDDWPPYEHSPDLDHMFQVLPPDRAIEVFMPEFKVLGVCPGGLWIGVWHPFVSGRLSCWQRVKEATVYIMFSGDVWFATMEAIAIHMKK